ncbi:MAG: DUF2510 domain-containing protein [Actinomycetes bacterium]
MDLVAILAFGVLFAIPATLTWLVVARTRARSAAIQQRSRRYALEQEQQLHIRARRDAAAAAASQPLPPAGWYPDEFGEAHFRWWDGTQWTAHIAHDAPTE